jgi:hypothetical protein
MALGQEKSTETVLEVFIKSVEEAIEKKNKPNWNYFRSYKSILCMKS